VPFIHCSFSYPTNPGILPGPFFRLWQKNMHRSKHGSDSGAWAWVLSSLPAQRKVFEQEGTVSCRPVCQHLMRKAVEHQLQP
jgi:hypothetical protein